MNITCISDLHGHYPKLEGGDLLIVAGDLTARHTEKEFSEFIKWLSRQNYNEKIFIGGNHDTMLKEQNPHGRLFSDGICYLLDWGTEFQGLKIYGSPWTKSFEGMNPACMAFTVRTDAELAEKWKLIPDDIDILVTHSPPEGIGDCNLWKENCGSLSLLMRATLLENLKLFVWGHVHEAYGFFTPKQLMDLAALEIIGPAACKSFPYLVNASHVNEHYKPVNKPIRIVL